MSSLENEIKILDINIELAKSKLQEIGAEFQYDVVQKIYVYDLQSISSRFNDCIEQAKISTRVYELEVIRNKLKDLFLEIDDLTNQEQEEEILKLTGHKVLNDFLLETTDNNDLIKKLSTSEMKGLMNNFGINPNKWIRLRETNGKSTITIKHILNKSNPKQTKIQNVVETEMEVPSIKKGNEVLQQLGFIYRNYQEKRRIKYILENTEIDIDCWPLIPPYMEIEDETQEKIKEILKKINIGDKEIVSCNTYEVYKKYGIDIYKYRELRLDKQGENK